MITLDEALRDEAVELLQRLVRNRCVNDGTPGSGDETRSAQDIRDYLSVPGGPDMEVLAPLPSRGSLVLRLEGTDPDAPSLCLIGHTDVVPANPGTWARDPFGGELVDGELWGRGAVDMLNLTASMAVAVRHLVSEGFRPRGTLVYVAVADEEAGGRYGAEWLVDHHYDLVRADYVVTESGGLSRPGPDGPKLLISTGEKGLSWGKLTVRGTPGHGSMPFGSDNALVKAAEVIRRLAAHHPTGTGERHLAADGGAARCARRGPGRLGRPGPRGRDVCRPERPENGRFRPRLHSSDDLAQRRAGRGKDKRRP